MKLRYRANPDLDVRPSYYSDGVPVFKPTMHEFSDFYAYNKAINKYGMQSGIVKIIPPTEWLRKLEGVYDDENLARIKIKNPIVQNINVTPGFQGVYSSQNVERQRLYDIHQWKKVSEQANFTTPLHKRGRGSQLPEPSPTASTETENLKIAQLITEGEFNVDVTEYTDEKCEELQLLYWRSLGYSEPMYGADMLGSLFKDPKQPWNVAVLPNLLDLMEEKLPGVNDAYLYAGLWKATFSWHLEDQDLYSINYLHFGAPKQWYSIPQEDAAKFYNVMKDVFPEDHKACTEFLRHKTFLASPHFLSKHGIRTNSIIHRQGEFMITYPFGYHSGFNYGFNLAESVNFALDDWFPFAEKTKQCECISDSVGINYKQIQCKFLGIPFEKEPEPEPKLEVENLEVDSTLRTSRKRSLSERENKVVKRKVGRPRIHTTPETPAVYECLLCSNNFTPGLKNLNPFDVVELLGQSYHRICYLTVFGRQPDELKPTPELDSSHTLVACLCCHTSNTLATKGKPAQGALVQCSHVKCTRRYHPTCALGSGFSLELKLCRWHRKSSQTNTDEIVASVPSGSLIQFTMRSTAKSLKLAGKVYSGVVDFNFASDQTIQARVFPDLTTLVEVLYENILIDDGTTGHLLLTVIDPDFKEDAIKDSIEEAVAVKQNVEDAAAAVKKNTPHHHSTPSEPEKSSAATKREFHALMVNLIAPQQELKKRGRPRKRQTSVPAPSVTVSSDIKELQKPAQFFYGQNVQYGTPTYAPPMTGFPGPGPGPVPAAPFPPMAGQEYSLGGRAYSRPDFPGSSGVPPSAPSYIPGPPQINYYAPAPPVHNFIPPGAPVYYGQPNQMQFSGGPPVGNFVPYLAYAPFSQAPQPNQWPQQPPQHYQMPK